MDNPKLIILLIILRNINAKIIYKICITSYENMNFLSLICIITSNKFDQGWVVGNLPNLINVNN